MRRVEKMSLIIAVILFTMFAFVSMTTAKQILRLGHELPENHPYQLGALELARLVNEKTDGEIEIKVYPNATLGTQKELTQAVSMGQLDFAEAWQGVLEAYDKNIGAVTMPYQYTGWDHVWRVLDGPIGDEVFKGVEEKGIKVVTCFMNGTYSFFSTVPIKTPQDIKGMKIRTQPSNVFIEFGEMLGAVVSPLAFSEVYNALQLGTIDAEIQGPINISSNKHYEVANWCCETEMFYLLEPVMMSMKTWNSLDESQQRIILESAKEAAVYQRELALNDEIKSRAFLVEQGMTFYKPDREVWEEGLKPMYDKHPEWQDIFKRIEELK
jgi:TRAP-type transport system periplasmic protein